MTTKEKIFIGIFNAIDPEYLNRYDITATLFFEELANGFSTRFDSTEQCLEEFIVLDFYSELAEFIDQNFEWSEISFSMSSLYSHFHNLNDDLIKNYENFKIKTIPILSYDY